MVVDDQSYTSTTEVTSYLVKHAPKPVKPGTSFIAKIHEDRYDPNFAKLLAVSALTVAVEWLTYLISSVPTTNSIKRLRLRSTLFEIVSRTIWYVLTYDRCSLGQDALERYVSQLDAAQHKVFYDSKLASNGFLLSIYQGTTLDSDKQAFFQRSRAHWDNLNKFISEELATLLPETPFFGGVDPGEDDFHLAAWLARIAVVAGGGKEQDGIHALEKGLGIKLDPKVSAYWGAWSARKSWQEVYAQGLH